MYRDLPFVAEIYDLVGRHQDRADIDFYVEAAREAQGAVLELGCGTGRVLLPIARAASEIFGLDISSYMLRRCRERLARESAEVQARVHLVQADMRSFELSRRFRLATTPVARSST